MRPSASFGSAIALVALATLSTPQPEEGEAFLEMGVRQVEEGDFEAAVFTLDKAVQKLAERTNKLTRAYVYLGTAYVGLDHEEAAKGKFRQALELDPELRLSRDEFSQRVIKVFESQLLEQRAASTRRGAKIALILGGVGAAAAVGISAATSEDSLPANRPPTASIGADPPGQALAPVTRVTFSASASDPDGDALSYRWDFGDGGSASGQTATHVFEREGSFTVQLTAEDGKGGSVTVRHEASARTLAGSWNLLATSEFLSCLQSGAELSCERTSPCPGGECWFLRWRATLSHPRRLSAVLTRSYGQLETCQGEAGQMQATVPEDLTRIALAGCSDGGGYIFDRVD